ncbi:hypothetical protein IDH44_19530 [Paenibacillus sp. IB182496]|uniref:HYR domain-containing protein n=1 Tax=Paenibacillus sabuli TaxID=2772509 RepID=A0A927BXP3_9BACL|nr:hypothetical protein [Paenibacillus sabuli]MBD2847399.1 hypothetical protein [Paenibacillus sabuli]
MSTIRFTRPHRSWLSALLVASLLVQLAVFAPPQTVRAAAEDVEVLVGQAKIGNRSVSADNMSINFLNNVTGFSYTANSEIENIAALNVGDIFLYKDQVVDLTIRVKDNPQLRQLAKSGHARVEIGWSSLDWNEGGGFIGIGKSYQGTYARMTVRNGGSTVAEVEEEAWHGGVGGRSDSATIAEDTVITIRVAGVRHHRDSPVGIRGMYIRFKDTTAPTLNAYSFGGDGLQRTNPNTGQQELYVKENEYIDLSYNFSEAVRPNNVLPQISDAFLRHPLFVNPEGTGLPANGQTQYLVNQQYTNTASSLAKYYDQVTYRYTGVRYHHSGNLPLEPAIVGTTGDSNNPSLYEKFLEAGFVDAAGNAASITFPGTADSGSDPHLIGKRVDPFDYDRGGFRVIVDAVRPKYSKTSNGIQPEILTGVTVNDNDTIDFTVQFSEEVTAWRDHTSSWDPAGAYLLFNNGMKAYYVSGASTDKWLFRTTLTEAVELETPLLKVVALSHDEKPGSDPASELDRFVLQDYAGNQLFQPANYKGVHLDGDESLLDSTIDWANLMIDNTKPQISFRFESGGASSTTYQKNGKATIDANDPNLIVPPLDPANPGASLPSRGIYRPSNMTGSQSPSVGLVYYYWSQSPANPLADKEADHHAALKRFALTGQQPRQELYPGELPNFDLKVVNNKTNMLAPPAEALLASNSGVWYLHAWTADMTWDSARELAQYEKMTRFIDEHPEQYEQWKAEAEGSEADKIIAANAEALKAVGAYDDLTIWSLEDYKQPDSNWSYNSTPFLLDNRAPGVVFEHIADNMAANPKVTVLVTDPHSGVSEAAYQVTAEGAATSEAEWLPLDLDADGRATIATKDHVFEDGGYTLHIRAADAAGNTGASTLGQTLVVDSSSVVRTAFLPESDEHYTRTHDVEFYVSGVDPARVAYAVSPSSTTPSGSAYTTVTESVYREAGDPGSVTETVYGSGEYGYVLPMSETAEGMQYVHILVEPKDGSRSYYPYKLYYFDNTAPTVSFSKTGVPYPQESQTVTATIAVEAGRAATVTENSKYQWLSADAPAPEAASDGWLALPEDGTATIQGSEVLEPGETGDFVLYVYAEDMAGNGAVSATGTFTLQHKKKDAPPASGKSSLIYMYGDASAGYTGIVQLNLDTPAKQGYEFSVSPDGGTSWSRWRPYTNFVDLALPTGDPAQLDVQVKYRSSGGSPGTPIRLTTEELSDVEPIYAIARLNTLSPVRPETGVQIQITPPLGIRVAKAADNPPGGMEQSGTTFTVRENGYYAFDLTDLTDPTRPAVKLYVVVNNVDDTAPQGSIVYVSEGQAGAGGAAMTSGNMIVKLETDEPVRVLNNNGRDTYIFEENGEFTFEFEDEAGNVGTATATVDKIDKTAPEVRIVRTYAYGPGVDEAYGTVEDGDGDVIAAAGVVLTVEKADPEGEEFIVVGGQRSLAVTANGTYTFTVSDSAGNTTQVSETLEHLVAGVPQPSAIRYTFVDDQGNPLPQQQIKTIGGVQYARGSVKVTVEGEGAAYNPIFLGTRPAKDGGGAYTNRISDAGGAYTTSRIFQANGSAVIALSDLLGNRTKVPVTVQGLDNTAPEIELHQAKAAILQDKTGFDAALDLGGYTVSDNVSAASNIAVSVSGLDLSKLGRQLVTYTAVDEVGNTATATQEVYVVSEDGMRIFANGLLISASIGESALFDTNKLTFEVQGYDLMKVGEEDKVNAWGTYELLVQSGLYREGQLKTIATKLTYDELISQNFKVTLPKAGWYTVIVRNQERERVFSTFFVGGVE